MKNVIILFLSLLICTTLVAQRYNVLDYDAQADGKSLCTEAIQKAVDACSANGGGQVYFPVGSYLSGTIVLKDNVELYLERGSILLASTRHVDMPRMPQPAYRSQKDKGGWFALIYANEATNIAIRGFGTIDGQGAQQKPRPELFGGDLDGRPRNILFISCKQVAVESIRMRNSGMWNQHYLDCEDVLVDKINVYNHSNRNNDGIDIDGCRRFVLSNSIMDSDDDCITLKSTGPAPCEDIVITNCVVSSFCNAIKAGTESTGGFKNISISNCVVKPSRSKVKPMFKTPERGITGLSLEIVDGGTMEGVSISNITIEGTQCPLYIRLGNRARKHIAEAHLPTMGVMKNIVISNVVSYDAGNFCSSITAVPGAYIENVSLSNIQFYNEGDLNAGAYLADLSQVKEDVKGYPQPTVWKNLPSSGLFLRHVKNIMIQGLLLGSNKKDPRVPIMAEDVEGLSIINTRVLKNSLSNVFFKGKDVSVYKIEQPLGWEKAIE